MHTATATDHARTSTGVARREVPLPLTAVMGGAAIAAAVGAAVLASPWILLAWLIPDLALLAGMSGDGGKDGRLAPRAVPAYNALHALAGPVGLLAASVVIPALVAPGLIWLSHILADRALGYGLRTPDGWQRA